MFKIWTDFYNDCALPTQNTSLKLAKVLAVEELTVTAGSFRALTTTLAAIVAFFLIQFLRVWFIK